jgi:hypothetical protein
MYKPYVRTNTGKQAISFGAIDLWKDLPDITKNLPLFSFFKQVKAWFSFRRISFPMRYDELRWVMINENR